MSTEYDRGYDDGWNASIEQMRLHMESWKNGVDAGAGEVIEMIGHMARTPAPPLSVVSDEDEAVLERTRVLAAETADLEPEEPEEDRAETESLFRRLDIESARATSIPGYSSTPLDEV